VSSPDGETTGTELVGFSSEEEVARVVGAVQILEKYAQDLPTLQQFRQGAAALTSNLLMDSLTGKYGEPRNMKEAIQVANSVVDLIVKMDGVDIGNEIAKVSDPAERKALLAEIRQKAREAQAK